MRIDNQPVRILCQPCYPCSIFSTQHDTTPHCIVVFGVDPSGGAGLQADIESIGQTGVTQRLRTAVTVQSSQQVLGLRHAQVSW